MVDKEAQEKIAEIAYNVRHPYTEEHHISWAVVKNDVMNIERRYCYDIADEVLYELEELGYRKLPEGEPPLLSDEQIVSNREKHINPNTSVLPVGVTKLEKLVAQAQRDSDIKWYGDELCENTS